MPSPLGKVPQCAHWGGRGRQSINPSSPFRRNGRNLFRPRLRSATFPKGEGITQRNTALHNNPRKRYKTVCIHTYPHYPQLSPQQETKKSLKYSGIFWRYQKISTDLYRTLEISKVDIMWITSGTAAGRKRRAHLGRCLRAGHPPEDSPPEESPRKDPEAVLPEPRRDSKS